jgi:hypothetical protein
MSTFRLEIGRMPKGAGARTGQYNSFSLPYILYLYRVCIYPYRLLSLGIALLTYMIVLYDFLVPLMSMGTLSFTNQVT